MKHGPIALIDENMPTRLEAKEGSFIFSKDTISRSNKNDERANEERANAKSTFWRVTLYIIQDLILD